MNKAIFLFVFYLFAINEVKSYVTYEWTNGVNNYNPIDCENIFSPTSSDGCWNPYGMPVSNSILVPSGMNLTITVPLNYTGDANGFESLFDSYSYGPTHAFPIDSFIVEENAVLQINSFVALLVNSDSTVNSGGSLIVNGKLAALDGKGDISVYGNLSIIGGNVQGSGLLNIMKGGVLSIQNSHSGQESYLLKNTSIQQGASLIQQSGVTHTGFWWSAGPVTIDIYGNLSLSGYFYDWEQNGFLNIQKGGYFRPTPQQMRGSSLNNYGTLDFSDIAYYPPLFTLTRYINNYALVVNDKTVDMTWQNVGLMSNLHGVFHALEDLYVQSSLNDNQGTFVAEDSTITFAEGGVVQYPSGYYGDMYGTTPFFISNYAQIKLNGSSFAGSGNVVIFGPITVYENLFINCYTQLEMEIYAPTFFTQGNFTVAPAVVFEIFGGGNLMAFVAQNSPPKNYYINVNGNLELNGITSNLIIKVLEGGIVTANTQNIFFTPPLNNPKDSRLSVEIWGEFTISGNFTSEISFVVYQGGVLTLESGSYLDLIAGAGITLCGGSINNNGELHSDFENYQCQFSAREIIEKRKEMLQSKIQLVDQKLEDVRSHLALYDIKV